MLVNANVSRSVLSGIRSEDPRDTQKPKVLQNGAKKKKKKSSKVQTWDYHLSLSFEVLYYLLLLHVPSEAK